MEHNEIKGLSDSQILVMVYTKVISLSEKVDSNEKRLSAQVKEIDGKVEKQQEFISAHSDLPELKNEVKSNSNYIERRKGFYEFIPYISTVIGLISLLLHGFSKS